MLTVVRSWVGRLRDSLIGAMALYLAQPVKHNSPATNADPQTLVAVLHHGDVLLTDGNTRAAALVKRITQSAWAHVAMYVGPLEDGADPRCIVEADVAAGVRAIRLSELKGLHVRVLRPTGLSDADRSRLADWVVSRIGGGYDLAHALALGRKFLRLPRPARLPPPAQTMAQNATRFICSSLLAHAFALIGYSLVHLQTPGDFERAQLFQVVNPSDR